MNTATPATFTVRNLLDFIELAGQKGWYNPETAKSVRTTCIRVFGASKVTDGSDIRQLNVERLIAAFADASPATAPSSLRVYRSRINQAFENYLQWKTDRTRWAPPSSRTRAGTGDVSADSRKPAAAASVRVEPANAPHPCSPSPEQPPSTSPTTIYSYPLRPGVTIRLENLPPDLTIADVRRIYAFLTSLACDYQPR